MGTSIIKFTAISGVHNEEPLCYLLEVDSCKILLDCGWDERFDPSALSELKRFAPEVDFVLLSHPDLAHVGALPYAIKELGLKKECLIVSTMPCWKMGHLSLYDAFTCRDKDEDFDAFTMDDIDRAFGVGKHSDGERRFKHLQYLEKFDLTGNGTGISVTAYAAGNMLGSSVWKIAKASEDDVVVYAVDYNIKKDRMLEGCPLEAIMDQGLRPAVFITDAFNATYTLEKKRAREKKLVQSVLKTVRAGGNVLIPIDTTGRIFELLLLLDAYWKLKRLTGQYPLISLNCMAHSVVDQANGYTQWMQDKCKFQFDCVKFCHSVEEMDARNGDAPKVVLTTFASLETGMARELFFKWAPDPRNTVLFTQRSDPSTLGRALVDFTLQRQPPPRSMSLPTRMRVELEGDELLAFREHEATHAEALRLAEDEGQRSGAEGMAIEVDGEEEEEAIDSEEEDDTKTEALVKNSRMFGCVEIHRDFDDYGELIQRGEYIEADPHAMHAYGAAEPMEEEEAFEGLLDTGAAVPTKCVSVEREVDISCALEYIDFEGRYEKNDLLNILRNMKPQKIVVVHATHAATEHLRSYCEKNLCGPSNSFAPRLRETLNVTSDRKVHTAHCDDALYKGLDFWDMYPPGATDGGVRVAPYKLAFMEATIDKDGTLRRVEDTKGLEDDKDKHTAHNATIVGDFQMSKLRILLAEEGFDAKFKDGMLICCDNRVRIKVSRNQGRDGEAARDQFSIEGAMCKEYYRIRDIVYEQFDFF